MESVSGRGSAAGWAMVTVGSMVQVTEQGSVLMSVAGSAANLAAELEGGLGPATVSWLGLGSGLESVSVWAV